MLRFGLLAIKVFSFFNNLEEVKVKKMSLYVKVKRRVAIVVSTNKQQRCTFLALYRSLGVKAFRG